MLDVKEEQKFKRLRELGQELHIPIPEAFLTLEVFDKDGKLIQRQHQRSHSWVRNAYNILLCQMTGIDFNDAGYGAGIISLTDWHANVRQMDKAAGFSSTAIIENPGVGMRAAAAEDTIGIVVGSGVNAESFEDSTLQTPIVEGGGGGQLNYTAMDAPGKSYAGLVFTVEWIRYINNNSGGNVNVNEVALVASDVSPGAYDIVYSRDHLASTVTVPDTGQLKVTYTIQLTYPS
ncbi:hypothetical protein ES704_02786 [subsurface metagenome]|jgi:hypothetical protein